MTRVSDVAGFADAVSRGGGMPFLALALLREAECQKLLAETAAVLGDRPWGVGILAFVPADLRAEQLKAVLKVRPGFAILAGGRPEQAKALESAGIRTYIHTPSAQLLAMFLRQGTRRFIFEGRECGGHVGPLSSFVLWESVLEVILEFQRQSASKETIDIVFAGGIHDGRSAAMVAALSAAAAAAGVRIGVLMGTAYLFTREAVETGAIVPGFQEEAVRCGETVLLEMGGGHAIRVAPSAYTEEFKVLQRGLRAEGLAAEEARSRLENVNVGRLRLASKGLVREAAVGSHSTHLKEVSLDRQKADGLYMMGQVAALRKGLCSIEELHRSVCCGAGAGLRESSEPAIRPQKGSRQGPEPIAIVGMACHLPAAADLVEYWSNILRRKDCIEEVPEDRWPSHLFYDTNPKAADRSISKWGGFMPPIRLDPMAYGIPPASLASVEPVHLMLLEVARKALADAGYDRRPFPRESTAVILGLGSGTWDLGQAYLTRCLMELELNRVPGLDPATREQIMNHIRRTLPDLTEDSFPGILGNVAAGRVANRFNLGGPNYTVDAACASSLAALESGLQTLWQGASDVALVGAAEAGQSIFSYLLFSKTGALSPRGRCRPFDATADGIATSDGVGMLVLKRLSDAERDGDRIYSVIRSIGSASDGREKSLTAPAVRGQTRAVHRAYTGLDFAPNAIELVEAHGTGTVVGDRTELETLRTVFQAGGARAQSCALGSVKSQIGHTKSTAGIAGLLKVSMALHQRVLPPTLVDDAAPALRDRSIPLYLNTRTRPWFHGDDSPRRAAVSAFGFGGTNFHVVLEEYGHHAATLTERPAELFVFRGPSRAELAAALRALDLQLAECPQVRSVQLADALRAEAAKQRGSCRLAIVAKDVRSLRAQLVGAADKLEKHEPFSPSEPIFFGEAPVDGRVAFLFPGQGSQYLNMMDELALAFPLVREVFERADQVLEGVLPSRLTEVVFPPPAYAPAEDTAKSKVLNQTWFAQPALGAADYALYALLQAAGIEPEIVAGHSYGEYVALCAAGALSFSDLIRISEQRGRVVQETQGTEAVQMVAVQSDAKTVSNLLAKVSGVAIAGINAPNQTIVGGRRDPVAAFLKALDSAGIRYDKLAMSAGFHIPEAQPAADQFAVPLAGVELRPPAMPVYSNLQAARYPDNIHEIRTILLKQLTQPLHFQEEVEAMYAAGVRLFVEAGPGQVLTGLVRRILGDRPATVLATNRKGSESGLADFLKVVGWFYAAGKPVRLERLFAANEGEMPQLATLLKGEELPKPAEWVVTGIRARPMVEKREAPAVVPVAARALAAAAANGGETASKTAPIATATAAPEAARPTAHSNGAHAVHTTAAPVPHASPQAYAPVVPAPVVPAPAPGNGHMVEVVTAFQSTMQQFLNYQMESNRQRQELMSRFLDTQRAMVEAFARGGAPPGPTAAAPQQPQFVPYTPPPPPPMVAQTAAPAPSVPVAEPPPEAMAPTVDPVAAPPPAAPPAGLSLQDVLLELISKRTGYPPELLELDQNLEADLGIDSIKRAEIFGGLLEKVGFSQNDQEREEYFLAISKLRTLREVLAWLQERAAEREAPAATAPATQCQPTPTVAESRPLTRFLVRAVEEPLPAPTRRPRADEVVLLTEDHSGRAREATAALSAVGVKAAVVRHSDGCREVSTGIYEADLTSREAVSQVREWVRQQFGTVTSVCHFLPLDCRAAVSDWLELKSLNTLAAVFGQDLRTVKGGLLAVTGMGGHFGIEGEPREFRPGSAAIALVLKCLAIEWPEVSMKSIDVDPRDGEEVLRHILTETASEDWRIEVGYSAGRRLVLKTHESKLDSAAHVPAALDERSVVLVTGGARGITAEICRELAALYRPTLILAGRSALPAAEYPDTAGMESGAGLKRAIVERRKNHGQLVTPHVVEREYQALLRGREVRSTLDELAAAGARTEYHALDVRDSAAFESLIGSVYERHGRIDGVIHGAGIVEDMLFDHKSPESFQRVFDTKVQPALVLARALRPDSLRFLFFLSSLAARYGYAGGTDYSSANEVLNRLARKLDREWKARVAALGYGPWESVGIASRYPPDLLTERGVEFHSIRAGVESFMEELRFGAKGEPEAFYYVPGTKAFPE
ncbi:MAG TPA: SDR family NAD(P)-dependent oxidoreductase [Bryobacteraceae bacterium]|nr:SDR family NAD(P)-dependent oxidoreductase [Bryobacteraceae bacterium]